MAAITGTSNQTGVPGINPYGSDRKNITVQQQPSPDNATALTGLISQLMAGQGMTNTGSAPMRQPSRGYNAFQGAQQRQPQQEQSAPPQQGFGGGVSDWSRPFIESNFGLGQGSPMWRAMMDQSNANWWAQQQQQPQVSPVGQAIASGPAQYAPADTYGTSPFQSGVVRNPSTGGAWSSPGFGAGLYQLGQGSPMPMDAYTDYGPRDWWGEN